MQRSSSAKITQPAISNVIRRPRLFNLLDRGRRAPVLWVSGPAGSGKTTLAAGYLDARALPAIWYQVDETDTDPATFFYYLGLAAKKAAPRYKRPLPLLTPEYAYGVPAFSRQFFGRLAERIKPPFLLVFDNYQAVPATSPFHEVFREGVLNLPPGCTAVIISRNDPPPAFAPLIAKNGMARVGWEEIRLSREETKSIVRREQGTAVSGEIVGLLHERSQGWAAGLTLLLRSPEFAVTAADLRTPSRVFDYFANEIFDRTGPQTRDFLLRTSFFPRMTAGLAEAATGNPGAERILSDLCRRHFFTEKRPGPETTYEYHPLFREFLAAKAKERMDAGTFRRIRTRSAEMMETAGLVEDAAEAYREACRWDRLIALALRHAPVLAAQGRTGLLERWIAAIPPETGARQPWLLYWKGTCRLAVDPGGARPLFERAYARFTATHEAEGRLLSWAGIVESYLYAWDDLTSLDRWIGEFGKLRKQHPRFPSRQIELRAATNIFAALFLRAPWHASLPFWEKRVNVLLREQSDTGPHLMLANFLMLYYTLKGDLDQAAAVYRVVRRGARQAAGDPPAVLIGKATEAYYCWFSGAREKSLQAVNEGLAAAQTTGVHLWDLMLSAIGVYNTLASGDHRRAETYLHGMEMLVQPGRRLDVAHYHYNVSWAAVLRGDTAGARTEADLFMRIGETSAHFFINLNRIAMAHVLLLCGEPKGAAERLGEVARFLKSTESAMIGFKYQLARAHAALDAGDDRRCAAALRKAFATGRARNLYNFDWWIPAVMQQLCAKALDEGIEEPYIRELIRRHGLLPDPGHPVPEQWPWPFRIRTLGSFAIEGEGKPIRFSGKVQKKPLELLKLLASAGGDLGEAQIGEALWPDAEGDAARQSLKTTLHRLRQMLGDERAIRYQDGRAGLDPRVCWTDVAAFERFCADARALGKVLPGTAEGEEQLGLLERALALYRGNFLDRDGDFGRGWTLSPRERLRSKFLRAATALAASCEQAGRTRQAVEWYLRGLDVDDLAEELYLGLMRAYRTLGRSGEAVKAYARCRSILAAELGVGPSEEMEQLRRQLKGAE